MTTAKVNLNVRIDKTVKDNAAKLLADMGLDHTTAIEMYYRQIINERCLPFQPKLAKTYGEQIMDIVKQKNIPIVTVDVNEKGHIIVDKDKDPELYDWAVNG